VPLLAALRPHLEPYIRWMRGIRRWLPMTSRQPSKPRAQPTSRRTAPCQATAPPAIPGPRSSAPCVPVIRVGPATGPDGATVEAWPQAGESYAFTAAASIRAVEEL